MRMLGALLTLIIVVIVFIYDTVLRILDWIRRKK